MNHFFKKTISLALAAALMASLTLPAAASDALGEDLTAREMLLNEDTTLTANRFWSSAYSDLRAEQYITYRPNREVMPLVTYGDVLTDRRTVTAAARELEAEGYRVVAGINGDFYNVGTGLPIGLVITDGRLRSSDSGYYAVGFRSDGSAVLGKPGIKVTADLGYDAYDGLGSPARLKRPVAAVNKARVSTGGIYLYTYDFNAKHTTGTTEPGVDVVCTLEEDGLTVGSTVELTVERVLDGASATAVGKNQVVLSVNAQSDAYYVDALRNLPVGTTVTLEISAADEDWAEVEYAVGALYALVQDGAVVSGLPTGTNPRTAVGQKRDGTLIFYTVDGRRTGHSIGASMSQVAQRLLELGCETAICLDGGGSTTLSVTGPDAVEATVWNRPSDGTERAVTNQIFLVADDSPSGRLSHFYVNAAHPHVLAGSRVEITASAVDSRYIPMRSDYQLSADGGKLEGNTLLTPDRDEEITVTASRNGKRGTTTVRVVEEPDQVAVRNTDGELLTRLSVTPGSVTDLNGSAAWNHLPLHADQELFRWSVEGGVGTIDENGVFTAGTPGEGAIVVSAGGREKKIEVTVSKVALQTVENFEDENTIFTNGEEAYARFLPTEGEQVRMGYGSGRLDYVLAEEEAYTAQWSLDRAATWNTHIYTSLNLWVYGDNSGNEMYLLTGGEEKEILLSKLDFAGWRQLTIDTAEGFDIRGLRIRAAVTYVEDILGNTVPVYENTARSGTLWLDQLVASLGDTVDTEAPTITAALDSTDFAIRAKVADAVDGVLKKEAVTVSLNGEPQNFDYDAKTGEVTLALPGPGESYPGMRITVTARDASGNIGRSSVDVAAQGMAHAFADAGDGYWGADFVDVVSREGIIAGYGDGTFRPTQYVNRAQFSVMLYHFLGLDGADYADVALPFADLADISPEELPAVRALYAEGIINGATGQDGRIYFQPKNNLTRAQASAMIGRTMERGYAPAGLTFADSAAIPAYATEYIQIMAALGVLSGYTDGTFLPHNLINRGQMAKILYTLM